MAKKIKPITEKFNTIKSIYKVSTNERTKYGENFPICGELDILCQELLLELAKLTIEKIEKQNNQKEWVVSSSKKYVLKEGKFGHYVEEWNSKTNTKTNNYSLKPLFYKISKDEKLDIKDKENIIQKITKEKLNEYIKEVKEKPKE